jgi:hypothetical protein
MALPRGFASRPDTFNLSNNPNIKLFLPKNTCAQILYLQIRHLENVYFAFRELSVAPVLIFPDCTLFTTPILFSRGAFACGLMALFYLFAE